MAEFGEKTIGILPNSDHQKLIAVLKKAEPVYDRLLWNNSAQKGITQKEELEKYASKASEIFSRFQHFYNSSWSAGIPFIVALYPIPGKSGNSTATAHANSLCVGMFTDDTKYMETIGVVLHEMCHVLYDEQPQEFQHEIEGWFAANKSPYRQYAYNFFDEALATALGNGWGYKNISGQSDTAEWYNNEYINGFAKELYPLVADYINGHRQLDKPFVDSAIALFAKRFPNAVSDYGILLNRVALYSDAESATESEDLMNIVGEKFQLTNTYSSSPLLDKTTLALLETSPQTQLITIYKNHKENLGALKKIFPQLSKMNSASLPANGLLSFYDKAGRPVIILYATDQKHLKDLVAKMAGLKYFDTKTIVQK